MTHLLKTALVAFLVMLSAVSPSLAQGCDDGPPPPVQGDQPST